MLDHISLPVTDYERSVKFYDAVFATLGYKRVMDIDVLEHKILCCAYGVDRPQFWIGGKTDIKVDVPSFSDSNGLHFAFTAPSVDAVTKFYEAALENGGKDNGAPGPREVYHPGYYGAFIIDPDGYKIEACLHNFEPS